MFVWYFSDPAGSKEHELKNETIPPKASGYSQLNIYKLNIYFIEGVSRLLSRYDNEQLKMLAQSASD